MHAFWAVSASPPNIHKCPFVVSLRATPRPLLGETTYVNGGGLICC